MEVSSAEQLISPQLLKPNARLCCPESGYSQAESKPASGGKRPTRRVGSRVLLVGLLRELALYRAEVLRNYGYRVLIPETVEDAMTIVQDCGFDVAVLSYTLPNQVVQELAETVRESCPHCPIIAISDTALADRRVAPDAVAIAQDGPPGLIEALHRVLHLPE